ncbi:Hypothetical protein UVM_LOCUS434, partial [uncultured virus]
VGGAKYTRFGKPWSVAALVGGFRSKVEALCFEYRVKHPHGRRRGGPGGGGIAGRGRALHHVLCLDRWTRKCVQACLVPLQVLWLEVEARPAPIGTPLPLPPHVTERVLCGDFTEMNMG